MSVTMCVATDWLSKSIFLPDLVFHPYVYIIFVKIATSGSHFSFHGVSNCVYNFSFNINICNVTSLLIFFIIN